MQSTLKNPLIKAAVVGFGSAALTLGLSAPANAVPVTCPNNGTACGNISINPIPPGTAVSFVEGAGNIGDPATTPGGTSGVFTFNLLPPPSSANLFEFEVENLDAITSGNPNISFVLSGPGPLPTTISAGPGTDTAVSLPGAFAAPGTYTVTVTGGLPTSGYSWEVSAFNNVAVPGPLPLMGAGMAFGFSRNLRRRVKKASVSA